jgi:hypothetical protein
MALEVVTSGDRHDLDDEARATVMPASALSRLKCAKEPAIACSNALLSS